MKNLSRVVSAILIVCMLCSCIYVNRSTVESVYANDVEVADVETAIDYIADIKCKGSVSLEEDKVDLEFNWTLVDGVVPTGYEVGLFADEQFTSEIENSFKELEGENTSVKYEGLDKEKTYYVVVKPYKTDEENDTRVYGNTKKCIGAYLDKPQIENAIANESKITVSITSVEGVGSYIVSYSANGEEKQVETTKTDVELYPLKEHTTYDIKVCSVLTLGDSICISEWSDIKSVTTKVLIPAVPTLSIEPYNLGAILTWNKVANATSYEIWRYYNKKWSFIKTVTGTSYTDKNLKNGNSYSYKVRAVRSANAKSGYTATKSLKAQKCLTGDIRMGYNTGKLKRSAKKYVAGSATKLLNKTKVKRGTKVTILEKKYIKVKKRTKTMLLVRLSNGSKYWIKQGNVRYNAPYTKLDYTTQAKERFVNKKGYSSKTKYLVFISHYTQRVYLFTGSKGKWKLKKTYRCATGKASTRSPQGVFKVTKKGKRTPAGSKYVTYFYKSNAFHARPAGSKTIGKPASNGCIRMYKDDAIFFYKSMPKGTTVVSY